jgi:hypothetical protein
LPLAYHVQRSTTWSSSTKRISTLSM